MASKWTSRTGVVASRLHPGALSFNRGNLGGWAAAPGEVRRPGCHGAGGRTAGQQEVSTGPAQVRLESLHLPLVAPGFAELRLYSNANTTHETVTL